jgi:hypothetical protein
MYVLGVPILPFSTIIRLSYGISLPGDFPFFDSLSDPLSFPLILAASEIAVICFDRSSPNRKSVTSDLSTSLLYLTVTKWISNLQFRQAMMH